LGHTPSGYQGSEKSKSSTKVSTCTMTVKVEKQVIYLGGGLTRVGWIVWDNDQMMGWHMDYDEAHKRAHDVIEQKEHRDGA
jgi:hypothetical protein